MQFARQKKLRKTKPDCLSLQLRLNGAMLPDPSVEEEEEKNKTKNEGKLTRRFRC